MRTQINLERLWEASDAQLASAYAAAVSNAHDAPHDMRGDPPIIDGSGAWARFASEAFRIGNEIDRRKHDKARPGPERLRSEGYSADAKTARLSDPAFAAFCAWVNYPAEKMDEAARFKPTETAAAWERVASALARHLLRQ